MEREYLYKCVRCGLPIHRVKVRVGRSGQNPHWEIGWRHVDLVVGERKVRCLRAVPPSGDIESGRIRGKRKRFIKTYHRRKYGWEKGKNEIVIGTSPSGTVGYRIE